MTSQPIPATRHRSVILLGAVVLAVAGLFAWRGLPIDAFPDVSNTQVMVLAEAPGLAPLDVEQQVTFPVELALSGLPGVTLVRSLSKPGLSQVVVVFEDDADIYQARDLVFQRLVHAGEELPEGVETEMGPIATGLGEVYQYTLESDQHDAIELRTLQDWVVAPLLRALPGVNEINSFGGFVEQVHVVVRPRDLLEHGLTIQEVAEALGAANANAGGGYLVDGWTQANVRSVGLAASADDLRQVVLLAEGGTPVTVGDVADVRSGRAVRQGAVTRDGRGEAVAGLVIMLRGANSRDVVQRVKDTLPAVQRALPDGVRIDTFYDRTDLVSACIATVRNALLFGGALVVLVLFVFLRNARAAVLVAASLPLTALATFLLMGWQGITANLMSLGGLAICIGMVADASIVVVENVVRHLRAGQGAPDESVSAGVREVARPIAFSVAIVVIVMVPLLTLTGVEGKMFRPLAVTMMLAMAASLVVALTAVPAAATMLLGRGGRGRERPTLLSGAYSRLLHGALGRPKLTLGLSGFVLAASLAVLPLLGTEFMPVMDEGAIAINTVRVSDASIEGSARTATTMEQLLLELPEVHTVVSKTGRALVSEDPMGPEQTDLMILLRRPTLLSGLRTRAEMVEVVADRLSIVPGVRLAFSQPIALRVNELISGIKTDLAVKVFGDDLDQLLEHANGVSSVLRGMDGASDVSVEQITGLTQVEVVPDRRALARHQLNVADVNEVIEMAVGGATATTLVQGQRRVDVTVRFPEGDRNDMDALRRILLTTPAGSTVPLGQVARVERTEGPAEIGRENGVRRVTVECNVRGRDLGSFVAEAQQRLTDLEEELPDGYWLAYGGTFENQQRAMRRLSVVVPVAVLLIFGLLLSAFRSARSALLVIANLPFALVGGAIALLVAGMPLSVSAAVGFIALFGTAVQNGTVLVSFFEQLRARGVPVAEAVKQGCALRLRPLMMTAATTVLALTPLLFARGAGSDIQRPLAVVVIGGLLGATALTLVVLPTLYVLVTPDTATREKEKGRS
jgi:heavy metal efflux system protein